MGVVFDRKWEEMSWHDCAIKHKHNMNKVMCDFIIEHIPAGRQVHLLVRGQITETVAAVNHDRTNVMLQMFKSWRPYEYGMAHSQISFSCDCDVRVRVLDMSHIDYNRLCSGRIAVGVYIPMPVIITLDDDLHPNEHMFWRAFQRVLAARKIEVANFCCRNGAAGFKFQAECRASTVDEHVKWGNYVEHGGNGNTSASVYGLFIAIVI